MLASKSNPWSSMPETNYFFWKCDCSDMFGEEILNFQNLYFPCLYFEKPTDVALLCFDFPSKVNPIAVLYNTTNFTVFLPSFAYSVSKRVPNSLWCDLLCSDQDRHPENLEEVTMWFKRYHTCLLQFMALGWDHRPGFSTRGSLTTSEMEMLGLWWCFLTLIHAQWKIPCQQSQPVVFPISNCNTVLLRGEKRNICLISC